MSNSEDKELKNSAKTEDNDFDEYDVGIDESEIPIRIRKKPSSKKTSSKKKKSVKKPSDAQKRANRVRDTAASLFSEKKFQRKKSIFEVMSESGEDRLIKPIYIFGHEFRLWPLVLIALVVIVVGMVAISNGSINVVTEQVTIVGLPADLEKYTALVISDMNGRSFGDGQNSLLRAINNLDYDIILCVGDMVGKDGDPQPFYDFLDGLSRPSKVYFICGDSDPGPFVQIPRETDGTLSEMVLEDWILGGIERGAHYVDAPIKITLGSANMWLTPSMFLNVEAISYRTDWLEQMRQEQDGVVSGLQSDYNTLPITSYRYAVAKKFYDAAKSMDSNDFVISLSHVVPNDDFILAANTHHQQDGFYMSAPELYVSGHYCGGVWRVPILGAVYVPSDVLPRKGWFPAQEDVKGASSVGESQVYISGGLSTNSSVPVLPFRLFNEPEVELLEFTAKLPESILD